MKTLFAKVTSAMAGAVVLLVGLTMAGLGLSVLAVLAMFALAALGLAILAGPFMAMIEREAGADDGDSAREEPAAA